VTTSIKLVTFGIVPTDANTGYGYIKSLKNGQVEAFVEKPDLQTAQSYLKQGNYLWNSGSSNRRSRISADWL
jgi:mannose-1-phosphate guanylyltransferase